MSTAGASRIVSPSKPVVTTSVPTISSAVAAATNLRVESKKWRSPLVGLRSMENVDLKKFQDRQTDTILLIRKEGVHKESRNY